MLAKNTWMTALMIAAAGIAASTASAQLALNELWENPPQNGDDMAFEYIEVYGPPNYNLTGYSVCMIKGILNDVLNTEVDEAFSLDGLTTNANGIAFVYNSTDVSGDSGLSLYADPSVLLQPCPSGSPCWNSSSPASTTNRRFRNGVAFAAAWIPSTDVAGKLGNDNSSTYFIVRRRPRHGLNNDGSSFYGPGYAWRKDVSPDMDLNSRLDYGNLPAGSSIMQPVQVVDELAWSNNTGYEYNLPGRGDMSNKLSDTPGFNPDGASRLRYLGANPHLAETTLADESWIYGESIGGAPTAANQNYPVYKNLPDGTERTFGAPTNPATSQQYSSQGFRMTPGTFNDAPAGSALAGVAFSLQPTGVGAGVGKQFRWVRGDFNFDGVVDCADRALIVQAAAEGWTLDQTTTIVDNNNTTANAADDVTYTGFLRQDENFNSVLAMIRMSLGDGSTGEWTSGQIVDIVPGSPTNGKIIAWGGAVTGTDLSQFYSEFPALAGNACNPALTGACCVSLTSCEVKTQADCATAGGSYKGDSSVCASINCCPADFTNDHVVDVADLFGFINAWLAKTPNSDFTGDHTVDVADLFGYINAWLAKC